MKMSGNLPESKRVKILIMENSLRQYIELYQTNKALICANSAGPLNDLREEACRVLEETVLPEEGKGNYQNVDMQAMLLPDYGVNLARVPIEVNPAATFRCDVPMLSTSLFLLVNDAFARTASSNDNLPEGVEIGSLRTVALDYPHEIADFYGKAADMQNPIVALDSLLVQDGFYLRIKKGVKVDKPIQLVNILENGAPLMAVRRLLVIIEEGASARLLVCDHTQNPDTDFLALETVEIFAGKNSDFSYYNLEESSERTNRLSALYLRQEEGSKVTIDGITLYNGTTRNEYFCRLDGQNADLRLYGMGIEDRDRRISTYSHITHAVAGCRSDELFKYTVDDTARGAFIGRILVAEGASGTEAFQSNRNLVGSADARMTSKPELEIYNDDVKCSHGTAIGQLDEKQVFYMRTRGLDEQQARLLLKQAFMADVIDGIEVEALRERLRHLVECRFAGEQSACGSCKLHGSSR